MHYLNLVLIMRAVLLFISISLADTSGNVYVGIPDQTWIDASNSCLLPTMNDIETSYTTDVYDQLVSLKQNITKVWIRTRLKYSYWTAFVGCLEDVNVPSYASAAASKPSVKTCLSFCSSTEYTYFAFQKMICYCLSAKPKTLEKDGRCRKKCEYSEISLCSSGNGSMVFQLLKDITVPDTERFLENRCLLAMLAGRKYYTTTVHKAEDCNDRNNFYCADAGFYPLRISQFNYQEMCFMDGSSLLFYANITRPIKMHRSHMSYWTPVFRTHYVMPDGEYDSNEKCLSMDVHGLSEGFLSVENCTEMYPFLCLKSGGNNHDDGMTIFKGTSINKTALIAAGIVVLTLLLVIFYVVIKLWKTMNLLKMSCQQHAVRGLNIVSYTELQSRAEGTYYRELNVDGCGNAEIIYEQPDCIDTHALPTEEVDDMGYQIPDEHYHTILDDNLETQS